MTGDLSLPFDITAQLQNEVTLDATIDKGGYSADEDSVAAGKAAIAAAITDKGVSASKNDSFHQLSDKIESIVTSGILPNKYNEDICKMKYYDDIIQPMIKNFTNTYSKSNTNYTYFTFANTYT